MPEISRFFGIIISIFYDDHNQPHFHARYGDYDALIKIEDFAVIKGHLLPMALGLVIEWADIHKNELMENWKMAIGNNPLFSIEPLK